VPSDSSTAMLSVFSSSCGVCMCSKLHFLSVVLSCFCSVSLTGYIMSWLSVLYHWLQQRPLLRPVLQGVLAEIWTGTRNNEAFLTNANRSVLFQDSPMGQNKAHGVISVLPSTLDQPGLFIQSFILLRMTSTNEKSVQRDANTVRWL